MQELTSKTFPEVIKSEHAVLIDFWAPWCTPCLQLTKTLEDIGSERIFKVNVDECPEIASQYDVRSIPTIVIFKAGEPVDVLLGNQPKSKIISALNKR